MKLPILFAGTADIGGPLLRALASDDRFELKQVITSPDRPAGRKLELMPSPIKEVALNLALPLFQPENINTQASLEFIKKLEPLAIVVFAYGQLFKKELLEIAPQGCLNIHTSLLPKYRGASPIQSAILNQDRFTGISLMQMVKKMDAGPVFSTTEVKIEFTDNSNTLAEKLAQKTVEVTPNALYQILTGELRSKEQDEKRATYCKKIDKADGLIDWRESAKVIGAKIRAFYGWPGTYTSFEGKRLKIISALPHPNQSNLEPGTVYESQGKILIQTGLGALEPVELQLEGKRKQGVGEFFKGNADCVGKKLGE